MERPGTLIMIGLLAWATFAAVAVSAQDLVIEEVAASADGIEPARERLEGLRHRYVRIDPGARGREIRLNLFTDAQVTAHFQRTERQLGTSTWIGSVNGDPFGSVFLGFHDSGTVVGKIETDGRTFLLYPMHNDVHAIIEVRQDDLTAQGNDMIEIEPDLLDTLAKTRHTWSESICDDAAACPETVVDLMVVYTPAAQAAMGGDAATQSRVAIAVSEMNEANRISGVTHTTRLVFVGPVEYDESGELTTDLARLRNPADGYMDEVHAIRDRFLADVVTLITRRGDSCGLAYLQSDPRVFYPSWSFNVVRYACLTSMTLAHEVGHNFGLRHDWWVESRTTPCPWGRGYVNQEAFGGTRAQRWRTIMAYNDQCSDNQISCPRVLAWSNPERFLDGDRMGVDRRSDQPADAVHVLNRSMCRVAEFRSTTDPLLVLSPDGGDVWMMNETVPILWNGSYTDEVDILLLRDVSVVRTIAQGMRMNSSLSWTVDSTLTPACEYRIRVQATSDPGIYDVSDQPFVIGNPKPGLAVLEPALEVTMVHGEALDMAWQGTCITGAHLHLQGTEKSTYPILARADPSGTFTWTIPASVEPGCGYVVRAVSSTNVTLHADSPGSLCVEALLPRSITLIAPKGGEVWTVGQKEDIWWKSQGPIHLVDIHLMDAAGAETAIARHAPNTGGLLWWVSDTLETGCEYRIRVSDRDSLHVFDVSAEPFCIDLWTLDTESISEQTPHREKWPGGEGDHFLEPAHPNPFNLLTFVRFGVRHDQTVRLELHSVLGRGTQVLFEGKMMDGEMKTVPVDGRTLASGTYVVRLIGRTFTETRAITLAR